MAISDKTRKVLWGRSGNRCAICRCELVMDASTADNESIVGDECHIVAREPNGPRGDSPLTTDERDGYGNLILLCKVHHKLVDDQPDAYTTKNLKETRRKHENWVRETLKSESPASQRTNDPFIAHRIETGQQMLEVVGGSCGFHFNNDHLESEFETELIGDFFQNAQDYLDIWDNLESRERVRIQFQMDQDIRNLEANGFLVYGCQREERIKSGNYMDNWPIAYVLVARKSNPNVVRKSE